MNRIKVINIPGDLAIVLHLLHVTSYALAKVASEQPAQARGHDPKDLVEGVMKQVLSEFANKPTEEQERLLNRTGEFIGQAIAAMYEGEADDSP